jgi:flagellar hook assembly protein FlgD
MQTNMTAGWQSFQWQGCNSQGNPVNTGVYFCRVMTASGLNKTIKMLLLK